MKNLTVTLFIGFLFASCSVHKIQGVNLNGKWTLNSVTAEGVDSSTLNDYKITIMNDVTSTCFDGSVWNLPNSGNGSYTIQSTNADCMSGVRQIYWSTISDNGVNYLQVKRLLNGQRPADVAEGYRMEITSATNNSFTLRAPTAVNNQAVNLVYSFTRQ